MFSLVQQQVGYASLLSQTLINKCFYQNFQLGKYSNAFHSGRGSGKSLNNKSHAKKCSTSPEITN